MRFCSTDIVERIGYDFYCDIANNIVKGRKATGFTQRELAEKTGIKERRLSDIELVRIRINREDVKKLSDALGISIDYLIDAEIEASGKECLYLVWTESVPDMKIYIKATSKRRAFLDFDDRLKRCGVKYSSPRERIFVKLVGVPVESKEIRAKFPLRTEEDVPLEPDQEDAE